MNAILFIGGEAHGTRKCIPDNQLIARAYGLKSFLSYEETVHGNLLESTYRRTRIKGEQKFHEVMLSTDWTVDQMIDALIQGFKP